MYVKITNGAVDQYPYTVGDLRRDNPNTSFPKKISAAILSDYGVESVTYTDRPSIDDRTQKTEQEAIPTLVDGTWTVGWVITSKTTEEIQEWDDRIAVSNRNVRTSKLTETDFYALSDVTMSAEMAAYRQALRDITTHANWPNLNDDDWPTKP